MRQIIRIMHITSEEEYMNLKLRITYCVHDGLIVQNSVHYVKLKLREIHGTECMPDLAKIINNVHDSVQRRLSYSQE